MRTRLLIFAAIACHGALAQPIISTIAGMGAPPSGIPATSVSIGSPSRIARDAAGNVYFAAFHCVYKVDPAGILTRVAGTGSPGFGGDGGPATAALLNEPMGVDVDGQGRLYIADDGNWRVRRVDTSGTIVTVAGDGSQGHSGDGGPATAAQLNRAMDVAADGEGNVYIADFGIVRKVSAGGQISTAAGSLLAGEYREGALATEVKIAGAAIATDAPGNLYIADGNDIRRVEPNGRIFTVVTGELFPFLQDVAVDAAGNVYVADTGNGRVVRIAPGGVSSTVASLPGQPTGIAVDSQGGVLVATSGNVRLWSVTAAGVATAIAGNGWQSFGGDGGPAVEAQLFWPADTAADSLGNLYVADMWNNRVRKIDTSGRITTIAGSGVWDFAGDGGPATAAMLRHPRGVAVDGSGNVYIADTGNGRIRKVDATGTITTFANVVNPRGLVAAPAGDLYVADVSGCRILKIAPAGQIQTIASLSPFCGQPTEDLAINGEGDIFVTYSSRVLRISAGGQVTILAGAQDGTANDDGGPAIQARLMGTNGVAVDPAGNVYLAEPAGHSVRKVSADGRIATVAGNRLPGFSGDGGLAPAAQLSWPTGLSMDAAGSLYIADADNHRIRKVTSPASPSPGLMIATDAFAGVTVLVDGAPVTERRVWTWPVGSQHLLDAPTPQLTDAGATRYRFSHWSQGGSKAQTIVMPEDQTTYTAHFHRDFRFRVTTIGSGTVSLNPPLPADGFYPSGTVVTMTATPAPGWLFPGFLDPNQGKLVNPWTFTVWGPRELNVAFIADGSAASGPLRFVSVTPCRVMDTRPGEGKTGPFGAPALEGGQMRTVPIPQSTCGIPGNAAAYSLNATVVPSGPLGFLTLWPAGQNQPQVSTLNSFEGRVVANAAIVPAGPGGAVNVFVTGETHVILDINGYFAPE